MSNKVVNSAVLSSLLLIGGCATVDENLVGDSMSPTGVSAAAGAIIGGGLGAIVGSTSGDAGAGLVIGSVAGAATGGIIGSSLEQQQVDLRETEETLARQEETLDSQKKELEQLRRELDEKLSQNNRPSSFSGKDYSLSEYSGNPNARKLAVAEASIALPETTEASLPEPRARLNTTTPPIRRLKPQADDQTLALKKAAMQKELELKESAKRREIQAKAEKEERERKAALERRAERLRIAKKREAEKLKVQAEQEQKRLATAAEKEKQRLALLKKQEAALAKQQEAVKTEIKSETKVAKAAITDPSCRRADKEADKARSAKSAADRLYYYRRALRFCPSQADYHVEIGKVYMSVGRAKDATYEFEQALRVDPTNTEGQKLLTASKEGN